MKKIRWYLECFVTYFKINVLVVMEYKLDFLAINLASILRCLWGYSILRSFSAMWKR